MFIYLSMVISLLIYEFIKHIYKIIVFIQITFSKEKNRDQYQKIHFHLPPFYSLIN